LGSAAKVRWAEHFPSTKIITCMARDKYRHMAKATCWPTIAPIAGEMEGRRRIFVHPKARAAWNGSPASSVGKTRRRPLRRCPCRAIRARTPARGSTGGAVAALADRLQLIRRLGMEEVRQGRRRAERAGATDAAAPISRS
jgi:hypothetical protein